MQTKSSPKNAPVAKKRTSGIKEYFPVKDSMLEKFFYDELKDICVIIMPIRKQAIFMIFC